MSSNKDKVKIRCTKEIGIYWMIQTLEMVFGK